MGVVGNGASMDIQNEAGVEAANTYRDDKVFHAFRMCGNRRIWLCAG